MSIDTRRPPIVTDVDRQWAIDQKPEGWDRDAPEVPWELHVAEQAERFEAHFGDDRKPWTEWSGLWRRVWWPKADPSVLHSGKVPFKPHTLFRPTDPEWPRVLEVLSPSERNIAVRFAIAPFKAGDARVEFIRESASS